MPDQDLPSPQHDGTMIEGFVLVGGASSRMGQDKSQMVIGEKKLFERAVAALSGISRRSISIVGGEGDHVVAGANAHPAFLPDLRGSGNDLPRAPIVGLYTALVNAKTPWIVVLACDLPFVTSDLMVKLASYCSDEFDAIVPIQPDSRPQPLCGLYRRENCISAAEAMLKTGDLKLQRFLSRISTRYVEFNEIADLDGSANFFLNINRPEDYETALKIALVRPLRQMPLHRHL